jgi:hypothetical protein
MSRGVLAALLALPLAACGSGSRPSTDLTVVALNPAVGRAVFHLTCNPAGGDVPEPGQSCAALGTNPGLIRTPKSFLCAGGTFSWWEIRIHGRLGGKPIDRTLSTCWTPQAATIAALHIGRWDVLHRHLVPRRHAAVLPGTTVTYTAGELRPTDLVTCEILGHHLEAGIPLVVGQPTGTGFAGDDVITVDLRVTENRDGSVTASCRRGARGRTSRISHHA